MQYSDPDFGQINVTVNPRARRIIMRAEVDGLRVTAPRYATKNDIINAINKHREPLKQKQAEAKQKPTITQEEICRMRQLAKALLPRRVAELAHLYHFSYTALRIQPSRTRWGSCSSRNSINLSLYTVSLPEHLQDYIILHELCHTVHHDHSPNFWALMDTVTQGKAQALNAELRNYSIP